MDTTTNMAADDQSVARRIPDNPDDILSATVRKFRARRQPGATRASTQARGEVHDVADGAVIEARREWAT